MKLNTLTSLGRHFVSNRFEPAPVSRRARLLLALVSSLLWAGPSLAQPAPPAFARMFAEGATGPFFDVRFACFNPDESADARVTVRYFTSSGETRQQEFTLPPHGRVTIDPENDDGRGVRGDMGAVVRAILLDPEARSAQAAASFAFGHMREPMLRFVTALRAFNGRSPSGRFRVYSLNTAMGQAPFRAPTVFNFFQSSYAQPGPIADAGLRSPEFQIATESSVIQQANTMRDLVHRGHGPTGDLITLDLAGEQALAGTPAALVDRLSVLLFGGTLSAETRSIVIDAVSRVSATVPLARARMAVHLLLSSPEFIIQK